MSEKSIIAALLLAGFVAPASAQEDPVPADPLPAEREAEKPAKPAFTPLPTFKKRSGQAARKESAGTRADGTGVTVAVLTPETPGYTFAAQPSFFWHQSAASRGEVLFSLYEAKTYKPVISKARIKRRFAAGINGVDLSVLGASLEVGVHYQWSITYEVSRRDRSKNAVSMGSIIRLAAPATLEDRLADAGAGGAAAVYSAEGAWYEVLAELDQLLKADPENAAIVAARDGLLREAGLGSVLGG